MKYQEPQITIEVDVTNPGQFFACCGLLELASRQWTGVEGCFDQSRSAFEIFGSGDTSVQLESLIGELRKCHISGLRAAEQRDRKSLEAEKKNLGRLGQELPPDKEDKRKQLGNKARKGDILIGCPFQLELNWWQGSEDSASPKTWAGKQEISKIACAAQNGIPSSIGAALLNHEDVLRVEKKKVEPFYFDARRFTNALDTGFSLDVQNTETIAHPAVELLCLIGLQRFRPMASTRKWNFEYQTWTHPLKAPVAAAVASCAVSVPGSKRYRFAFSFRDNQKRYKAFGFAVQIGGDL